MQKRRLGRSGLEITPLMLGGNVFGWTADERHSFEVLDAFVDGGGNAIDTADVYSAWVPGHEGGESERVIGAWMKARGNRDKVVVATKVAMWPKQPGLKRANILSAVEGSLTRLQTDYIDLYQAHQDDAETPIEESIAAFDALVQQGKVRAIGASNFKAPRLAESVQQQTSKKLARYETLQPEYNLMARGIEEELQPLCVKEQISLIPYYGLASGFLTGKYRSAADKAKSPRGGRMDKYLNEKGFAVLGALDEIGARHDATPAQVALAWVMARPAIGATIASATSVDQIRELMRALRVTLNAAEIAELDRVSA